MVFAWNEHFKLITFAKNYIMDNHLKTITCLMMTHDLIRQEQTGTSDELASCLQISRWQLDYLIDTLNDFGASVKYSRLRHSFYYNSPLNLTLSDLLV